MRLLLDTHIFLWALVDDIRLSEYAREFLLSPDAELFVSAASIWEISIKHSLGRGDMPISGEVALQYAREAGYTQLAISSAHCARVEALPSLHADPFDRLIVAQALHEPMRLMTHDRQVAQYSEGIAILV